MSSTRMFSRRRAIHDTTPPFKQASCPRSSLPPITDDDNDSNEPSLANSSVSSASRQEDDSRLGPLHKSLPLHPQSSLLDMTRDDSHDTNTSAEISMDLGLSAAYHSPNTSLLDEDEEDDDDELPTEAETFTLMERGIANISESLSGSFCTQGNEVNNSCTSNCTSYISDRFSAKKTLFSDRILQNRLMDDFHYILGSNASPCCTEKSLFTNCLGKDFEIAATETILNLDQDGKVRNRAGESWRARAYRIKRLREERMIQAERGLTFDDKAIARSTSFTHHRRQSTSFPSMRPKQEANVEALGCMIGNCIEPISKWEDDQDEIEMKTRQEYMDEQDLCYDSDPGIVSTPRRKAASFSPDVIVPPKAPERSKSDASKKSPIKKWFKSPRRRRQMHFDSFDDSLDATKVSRESDDLDHAMDLIKSDFYGNSKQESFDDYDTPRMSRPKSKRGNVTKIDRDIQANVQDALNHTWTLSWHPPSDAGSSQKKGKGSSRNLPSGLRTSTSIVSPRCIKLWFERGNRINQNDIVEPKLMWRDAYHPDLVSQRKLNFSTTQGPQQICLLNICRIIEATNLNREKYPFAKQSCSFIIRTSEEEEFVFETASEKQRNDIVHTWKLVVARLASQAVVGDGEGMVGEFFVSSSFGVP